MFGWLKGFPFTHYIVMAAAAVAVWMYGDLTLTRQALANEQELRQQWQQAAEVQADVDRRDTIIIRASDEADRAIQEAPNADTLVPPDVASAWAAGIDSVRDAGAKPADEHVLRRPSVDAPKRSGPDGGRAVAVLKGPRGSVLAV